MRTLTKSFLIGAGLLLGLALFAAEPLSRFTDRDRAKEKIRSTDSLELQGYDIRTNIFGDEETVYRSARPILADVADWTLSQQTNDFTIAVIPDSQYQTNSLTNVCKWIGTNSVKMTIHVGDAVDDGTNVVEWSKCLTAMLWTRGGLLMASGNHDIDDQTSLTRSYATKNAFFNPSIFTNKNAGFGYFGTNSTAEGSFVLQTNGANRFIYLALECFPRTNVMIWANTILSRYSNHVAIVVTHSFLDRNNTMMVNGTTYSRNSYTYGNPLTGSSSAQELWEFCLKKHPNLALVLCGHQITGNTGRRLLYGERGNAVNAIFQDYQYETLTNNAAWIRLLRVSPGRNRIDVRTYDPVANTWRTNYDNQFSIKLTDAIDTTALTQPERPEGLRLRLNFDEGAGMVAADSSGWENNGVFTNLGPALYTTLAPAWSTNAKSGGYSLQLSGSNTVWIETSASLTNGTAAGSSNLTVAIWFKPDTGCTNVPILISKHNDSATFDGEWMLRIQTVNNTIANDAIQAYLIGSAGTIVKPVSQSLGYNLLSESAWHHAAMTYDGANVRVYLDGLQVAITNFTGPIKTTLNPVFLGSYCAGTWNPSIALQYWYSGLLDDARMYARTLRPEEIACLAGKQWIAGAVTNIASVASTNFTQYTRSGTVFVPSNHLACVVTNFFVTGTNTILIAGINHPISNTNILRYSTEPGLIRFKLAGQGWQHTPINYLIVQP